MSTTTYNDTETVSYFKNLTNETKDYLGNKGYSYDNIRGRYVLNRYEQEDKSEIVINSLNLSGFTAEAFSADSHFAVYDGTNFMYFRERMEPAAGPDLITDTVATLTSGVYTFTDFITHVCAVLTDKSPYNTTYNYTIDFVETSGHMYIDWTITPTKDAAYSTHTYHLTQYNSYTPPATGILVPTPWVILSGTATSDTADEDGTTTFSGRTKGPDVFAPRASVFVGPEFADSYYKPYQNLIDTREITFALNDLRFFGSKYKVYIKELAFERVRRNNVRISLSIADSERRKEVGNTLIFNMINFVSGTDIAPDLVYKEFFGDGFFVGYIDGSNFDSLILTLTYDGVEDFDNEVLSIGGSIYGPRGTTNLDYRSGLWYNAEEPASLAWAQEKAETRSFQVGLRLKRIIGGKTVN
jgi:hypothetical protein